MLEKIEVVKKSNSGQLTEEQKKERAKLNRARNGAINFLDLVEDPTDFMNVYKLFVEFAQINNLEV